MAVAAPEVALNDGFIESAMKLQVNESGHVWKTIDRLRSDPDHPSLNLHPVKQARSRGIYTARVTQELRMLLVREGSLFVLFEVGHHDAIYDRAQRSEFVVNAGTGYIGLVTRSEADAAEPSHAAMRQPRSERSIFDHWADAELARAGIPEVAVPKLRGCSTEDQLLSLDITVPDIELAIELLATTPEEWATPDLRPPEEQAEEQLRSAITSFGALNGLSKLFTPDELATLAAAPIETWMVFLHPEQRTVVERRLEGPGRIKGGAGTGKTVVALHRAAELAARYDTGRSEAPILFTTFVKSLVPVMQRLYLRLPGTTPSQVAFANVDKLAVPLFYQGGGKGKIDPPAVESGFASAWRRVVTTGSPIAESGLSRDYLKEEVRAVIKGRALASLDDYLQVERTGRRTRFPAPLRQHVWELRVAWDEEVARRGAVDFADVILGALEYSRELPEPRFRSAIIDEAQDLSLASLLLIRRLVNGPSDQDRPDGLLIVGDGAQRVYPGGYSLRQAGIEVRGRTTILRRNYRNTDEILRVAGLVAGDVEVDDIDDTFRRADALEAPERHGSLPRLVQLRSTDDELEFLTADIERLVGQGHVAAGDIGIFTRTNKCVDELTSALFSAGLPTLRLDRYDGETGDQVKIGTYLRAKGLEFKAVYLPGLDSQSWPRKRTQGQDEASYEEQRRLDLSQLFVALTRARDQLTISCTGEPADAILQALDALDIVGPPS